MEHAAVVRALMLAGAGFLFEHPDPVARKSTKQRQRRTQADQAGVDDHDVVDGPGHGVLFHEAGAVTTTRSLITA